MTIDERIEFLMQSVESHDRQIGEMAERMDLLTERVDRTTANIDRLTATTQLNFERLSMAMMGLTEHVADHQRRIEKLER